MSISSSPISKTAFLKFDQCSKAFFLYKKHLYLRDPVSKEKQFTFNRGHHVGQLAQQLFPGGIDVSLQTKNSKAAYELTQELLKRNNNTIYEATFIYNNFLVMVDLLHFDGSVWNAYEIKSSLKISDTYIKDACLQYYVLKNTLQDFSDLFLVTLNPNYILDDEIDLKQLFRKRSVKENAKKNIDYFDKAALQMNELLEQNVIPDIQIGKHCFSPYECDFVGTCWKNTNDLKSVFRIGKSDREQLFSFYFSGAPTVDKIDLNSELKPHVKIQVKSINSGEPYFDKKAISNFLGKVDGNFCFLDMEIWSPAIPNYKGTGPFEQIPFLFSICYLRNGAPVFKHYLKPVETDSRYEFLIALLESTQEFASVLVFDKNLEQQILGKLENLYPEKKKEIGELREKLIDLAEPVQNFYFYHPKFKGNFSLKAVSEVFDETSDYSGLDIASGIVAMHKYEGLLQETNPIINEQTKQQLIDYCNADTLTCLKFFNYLKNSVKE